MISTTLNPIPVTRPRVDAEWLTATAEKALEAVEERRSTWQSWHVRAEAQRQVRAVQVPTNKIDQLVELLVTEVLHTQSISLTRRDDGISEPVALRRIDGSSVYTVAGSGCSPPPGFWPPTSDSSRPLAAPTGVLRMPPVWIWLCWNQPRTGTPWTWDRPLWSVLCAARGAAAIGHRAAGAGKTTAMRILARAWTERRPRGRVGPVGRRAAQLRDATVAPAETLAKLTWSIRYGELPDWAERIGRSSLVIIDEAGMADTLSLDTAVQFIICRGSIRLVGDDPTRRRRRWRGAPRHPSQLWRGPAHRAAPVHRPFRGRRHPRPPRRPTEALGFYLDRRRVHVGDPTTTLDAVFNAWQADRSRGLDAIMLAPTRELVSRLNQRRNCATPNAVPATRRTTTRPFDQQPPVRRLAPPLAFGPSWTRLQVNFPISWPPSGTPPRA